MIAPTDTQLGPAAAGCCRIGPLWPIPHLLTTFGADAAATLKRAGVDPGAFSRPDGMISYHTIGRLLVECVTATGCAHFGLLVGQHASLATLGLVGRLAGTASNVRGALQTIIRYLPIFDRVCAVSLHLEGDSAVLSSGIAAPGMAGIDQSYDLIIAVAFNTLRDLCGGCCAPGLVTLPHRAPPDARPFRKFFQAELRFDAPDASLRFDSIWLDRPLSGGNAAERLGLLGRAEAIRNMLDMTTAEQVSRHIRASLPARWPSADEVAEQLRMSTSTLRRHLAREGCTYRMILDELRMETARQYLEESYQDCGDIALLLGYSEASAFTRAFRRWFAVPPTEWRERDAARMPDAPLGDGAAAAGGRIQPPRPMRAKRSNGQAVSTI